MCSPAQLQKECLFCLTSALLSHCLLQCQLRRYMAEMMTQSLLSAVLVISSCKIWNQQTDKQQYCSMSSHNLKFTHMFPHFIAHLHTFDHFLQYLTYRHIYIISQYWCTQYIPFFGDDVHITIHIQALEDFALYDKMFCLKIFSAKIHFHTIQKLSS